MPRTACTVWLRLTTKSRVSERASIIGGSPVGWVGGSVESGAGELRRQRVACRRKRRVARVGGSFVSCRKR
ncbi:hypothetical protein Pen02_36020 [Plantactinospora endophytica]|uniref:Uncharacterized protein n=1 Tax=Plantactinospora endophytica TaxID=673535 RepID=A0ABQ4E2W4_9ACTN|nr:hypothetical protein Pen02_36020 [Plantactinospora endophytica]